MKVKTNLRAGVTVQEVAQGVQDTAGKAAQTVGNTVQGVVRPVQRWWNRSGAGDTFNKVLWFPLEPPK